MAFLAMLSPIPDMPESNTMRHASRATLRYIPILAIAAVMAACAPAPIYKTGPDTVTAAPAQVAVSPDQYRGRQVIWGGSVISVQNLADHSEVEILAYPLDSSQRPRVNQPALGRFIAVMPGFVEPMSFPAGALVTLRGTVDGAHGGTVGQAPYTFALVRSETLHRWTADEMSQGHPNVSFGVGVGTWIN